MTISSHRPATDQDNCPPVVVEQLLHHLVEDGRTFYRSRGRRSRVELTGQLTGWQSLGPGTRRGRGRPTPPAMLRSRTVTGNQPSSLSSTWRS